MASSSYRNPTAFIWHSSGGRCPPRCDVTESVLERGPSHVPQADSRKRLFQRCVYQEPRTSHGHTHALISPLYYPHTPQLRSTSYILPHAEHDLPSPKSFRT